MTGYKRIARAAGVAAVWLMLFTHAGATRATTARITHVLEPGLEPGGAAVSPDGAHALTWSRSEIRFWDLASGLEFAEDESEQIPDCRRHSHGWASPDGKFVALACKGVVLIDMRVSKVIARLGEDWNTRMVTFSADSRRLVRLSETHRALATGGDRLVQTLETYEIEDYLDPSWFGQTFRSLFGYDENEPDADFSFERSPSEAVSSVLFSAQPDQLLLGSITTVEIRSTEGKLVSSVPQASAEVVTWSCPGGNVSAVSRDEHDSLDSIVSGARGEVTGCVLKDDHSEVWLAHDEQMTRWDAGTGRQLWFHSRQGGIAYLAATPDLRFLAAASMSGEVNIFDWKGRHIAQGEFPKDKVHGPPANECAPSDRLVSSVDGQTVLFVDCKVYVWKVE